MNFFKRLFSSNKEQPKKVAPQATQPRQATPKDDKTPAFEGIVTEEYFATRYTEEPIDAQMLDGALKMVESYFLDNKIERQIKEPINHPINLDQTVDDGFGFSLYCKAFNLEEIHALMFLAMSFNDFMIKKYGFTLYKDNKPEYPLRTMTLKYDKSGTHLSLYPIEFASKVLTYDGSFEELHQRIDKALGNLPSADDLINKMTGID